MKINAVTFGIPVKDIDLAVAWYRRAFELGEPDVIPMDGLVEWNLGPFWLQLATAPALAGVEGASVNLSVDDSTAERERLAALGLAVSEVTRFEGAVEFFELTDLDGNKLGFVTELG